MFEESDLVAGMLEFVDIGPDLRLPRSLMSRGLATTGAACVKSNARTLSSLHLLQFKEDAAHFFNLFVRPEDVLVPQQVSKAQFARFKLRFLAGMERPVFRPQLLG